MSSGGTRTVESPCKNQSVDRPSEVDELRCCGDILQRVVGSREWADVQWRNEENPIHDLTCPEGIVGIRRMVEVRTWGGESG